ncbi:hypothetical protein [Thermogutta sp.]
MLEFHVDDVLGLSGEVVQCAYFAGLDRVPWPTRGELDGNILRIWRDGEQSGSLTIPIKVRQTGWLTLATATLAERYSPYDLLVELTRGRVGHLRNQMEDWQLLGLDVPGPVVEQVDQATTLLAQAIIKKSREHAAPRLAWEGLQLALEASSALCQRYVAQAISVRKILSRGRIPFWLGVTLTEVLPDSLATQQLAEFSNATVAAFPWRAGAPDREQYSFDWPDRWLLWCRETGLYRGLGPLLDLRPQGVPTWIDFEQPWSVIQRSAFSFIEATVRRYRGRVDFWEVAGPLNVATPFPMPEDKLATFVAGAVQLARELDPGAVIALSIRQPWLEDLRMRECQYPAPFVVDALIRARVGLDALVLEVDLGYVPGGTLLRDALEWHRQLEYWGQMGLPIYVRFSAPSQALFDPLATGKTRPVHCEWTPDEQAQWTRNYFLMALAKPFVRGFLWANWADFQPHEFPHSGLLDLTRRFKPVVEALCELRRSYLL